MTIKKEGLIYPDLSYEIVGLLYETHNELGFGYQEKYYQRAFGEKLKKKKINFKREISVPIKSDGKIIGRYFLDFLIEGKIVVELKVGDRFRRQNIEQVYAYLKSTGLKLGLIANFTKYDVKIKRIVNINDH